MILKILIYAIIGALVGLFACRLTKGKNCEDFLVIGVIGGVVGGFTLRLLFALFWTFASIITALIGAVVLVLFFRLFIKNKKKS